MTIGKSHYKIDAHSKVTGEALYPGDITPEQFLFAKVLFSGQPHARMVAMDLAAALALEGVVAIYTAADVPLNEYGLTMFDQPVMVGLNSTGRSAVPSDVSRWEGDHVAIIVAETDEAAAAARDLIDITWEQLPLITDVREALRNEHLLHPEQKRNDYHQLQIRKGDIEAGWEAADVVVSASYQLPFQEHAYLQPEAAVSYVDSEGRATVEIAGQWTHEDQEQIAHALDLPLEKVRVIYPAIGGAFGGREDASLQIVMALASLKLHEAGESRPIRCIWSREESIVGHHKRHQGVVDTRWGATKDGRIVAVEADVYLDAGAYNYTSNKVLGNFHLCVGGPYNIPNARITSRAIYTNNIPGGAFRGFGAPQGAFVAESQLNRLAAALGMDPVAMRLLNCLREGDDGITQRPLPAGVSLPQVIEKCAEGSQWDQPLAPSTGQPLKAFQSLPPDPNAIRRGRGFACAYKNVGFSFGFPERCEADVVLHGGREIERVVLYHAAADVGQGVHTVLKQMAAEAAGVSWDKVELVVSDTAVTGDSGSVSASRMTFMAGHAVQQAMEKALQAWDEEERPARGHARYTPRATETLDPITGIGDPNISYGYVAQSAEIAVDIETGHIYVERVVCANDVGKAINPNLVEGQIEGAVVQAHGYALTENLQSKDGHILNPRLSGYLIPGILDIPEIVDSQIMEIPDPQGPWGARGMAEMPMIPLAPAITAALFDATGVWFDEIPLTPSRVRAKLRQTPA